MSLCLADLASRLGAEVAGDGAVEIGGLNSPDMAGEGDLVFADNAKWLERALASNASAVLTCERVETTKPLLIVPDVRQALQALLALFEVPFLPKPGVSPLAAVHPEASVGENVDIGPFTYVGAGGELSAGVKVHAFCYVGAGSRIGPDTILYPRVTLYPGTEVGARCRLHSGCVIGGAGFGYRFDGEAHRPIPQIGKVILGDDVDVGSNVTVDRAMIGATVIGKGAKIDNLVQIAHNVRIGDHCIIVAQAGLSGSVTLGDNVVIGGQTGIIEHLRIGSGVRTGGQTGVTKDLIEPGDYWGTPARPMRKALEALATPKRVDRLTREVEELRRRLAELEERLE